MAAKKKNLKKTQVIKKASAPVVSGRTGSKKNLNKQPLLPGRGAIHAAIFLFFVLATQVLYSSTLHIGFFNLDDPKYVLENPWIRKISFENISFILSHSYFANYSPIHLFSYMLDYAIGGDNAFIFHLSNNLWAGIVAGFVYLVCLAITQKQLVSIAAATLFVFHPVHVEAVVWISSRKDLVAAAFILPSFLTYLMYLKKKSISSKWYILSVFLFLLAVGGKLSVAVFPAVLVAYDLYVEKRKLFRSLIDKIPHVIITIIFTIAVMNAQPPTGGFFNAEVVSKSFFHGLWLLSGFGTYVIYRVPPEAVNFLITFFLITALILLFIFPLFIRKRYPRITMLIYWILFTYFPSQVLSFVNPVADRYLFLPSVAFCILIAWGIFALEKYTRKLFRGIPFFLLLLLAIFWTKNTLSYLNEWKDPRSVWYAASKKSSDMQVNYNLGLALKDKAARIGSQRRFQPLDLDDAKKFAIVIWKNHSLLPQLLQELSAGQHSGPVEDSFRVFVQNMALENLNMTIEKKGNLNIPDVFYYKGDLLLAMGKAGEAKDAILKGIEETKRITYEEWKQEMIVRLYSLLSDTEYELGNYLESLKWVKLAEEEQIRYGGNWKPNLSNARRELERIIDTLRSLNQIQ